MPAGIRVTNGSNILLIDERFYNYTFVSKSTITFASNNSSGLWTGGSAASAILTISGVDSPIVAARSSVGWVLAASGKVGSNWVFHFSGGLSLGTAAPGDTMEVFVFDRPRTLSGPGVGLRVWDEAGLNVYDSRQNYLRILDYRTFNVGLGVDVSVAGNIAQVILLNAWAKSLTPTIPESGQWLIRAGFIRPITGGYNVSLLNYAEGSYNPVQPPPFSVSQQPSTTIMTIDVSGY